MQSSKLIIITISALLLAGCFQNGKPEPVGKPGASQGEGVEIEDRVSKLSKQFGVTLPDGVKKAALNAVDGSASSGLATIEEVQGARLVTVLANLPDLTKREMYVARLSGGDKLVILGSLSIAKGGWILEQRVNADPNAYKTVEVLKGTQVILRGVFE